MCSPVLYPTLRSPQPGPDPGSRFRLYHGGKGRNGTWLGSWWPQGDRPLQGYAAELIIVWAGYFLGGRVGLAIPLTSGNVSPVWPPAGIALAALLLLGNRVWPAIALGAFAVNFFTPIPHLAALVIALGNTLGPLTGALLLQRTPGFQPELNRLRDVLRLIVVGGLAGTAISATLGTTILFLSGVNPWSRFGAAWLMWWFGDAMGVLIITPAILALPNLFSVGRERWAELAALLLGGATTSLLIFGSSIEVAVGAEILVLGLVPFILWSAIRFELGGAVALNLLIAGIAVWETGRGLGPLARQDPLWSAGLLQSFLCFVTVQGMALATVVAERARIVREQGAQAALRQSEKRYGGILESAHDGIWMLDAEFRTRFVNRRLAELLGYSVEEMTGRPVFDFLFPEDVEGKKDALERRRRGISEQVQNRYRKKDGSEFWVRVSSAPIFSPDGKFEGAVKWFLDPTEEKRGESERRSAMELLMLLSRAVQQTADSIMITDSTGIIEYVNPAFEAITGFTQDEAVGKTPRIVKSGRQGAEFYKKLWGCITEGKPFRGTLQNRKKSGELYWGEQTITPVTDDAGSITHFVSVVRDVTDSRKKQEQEVQLQLAREVQQRFYARPVAVPGLDVEAAVYPAEQTGGDYFDLIAMPDNSLYVGIGDVSGHGLGSALVMALIRAYVRSFAELQLGLGEIAARVNRLLMADLEKGQFATLLLIRIAPERDSLAYCNAGHVPGLLCNGEGEVEHILGTTAIPLGLFDTNELPLLELQLKARQTLVLLTDGITEAATPDDVDFGIGGAVGYMRAHCGESASQIAHGLCQAARAFAGNENQRDDVAAVVVKVQ